MRKLLIFTIFPVVLFGCQKEHADSLEYTYWIGYNNGVLKKTIHFLPDYECRETTYWNPFAPENGTVYEIKYSHEGNNVVLIQSTGEYASGTISGGKMTLDYGFDGGVWTFNMRE